MKNALTRTVTALLLGLLLAIPLGCSTRPGGPDPAYPECSYDHSDECDPEYPCTVTRCDTLGRCWREAATDVCRIGGRCFPNGTLSAADGCLVCDTARSDAGWSPVGGAACGEAETCVAGAMCDDGDPCTVSDLCTGGQCRGTPMDCSALEGPCGTGLCFEGACLIQPRVGAACDDANPQTSADTCRPDGSCRGTFDETLCACGDHGTCVPGESGCRCDAGYAGADCGACTTGYVAVADGCVPGCPAGMSRIGDTDVCMDHYEAQAFERPDCTGTQYTPANMYPERDYPAGFPADVESDGVAGSPQTQAVYACSLPGRLPSWRLTWYQARRACENSGKRLCTQPEWSAGCAGPTDSAYPYGDHYDPAACNGKDLYAGTGSANQTLPGGAMSGCHGSGWATDIHDTSGNLWELVEEGLRVGGSNGDLTGAKLSCSYSAEVDLWSATWWSFRCCKDL